MSGSNNPFYGRKGTNQYAKGVKMSDETRRKISEKSKNQVASNETKAKISESMKRAHLEGRAWNIGKSRWNNEPSYPEIFFIKVIENEFEDNQYVREFPIGIYSADFCWPSKKRIIEIDGDQHQRFEEYVQRDLRKDEFIRSLGYEILRISWKDLFHNTKDKIKEAYQFIHGSVV